MVTVRVEATPDTAPDRKAGGRVSRTASAAWPWRLLLPLTALQAALLLYRLGRHDLWLDEVMSLNVARAPFADLVRFFRALPEQHPLYYALLRPWVALGTSETMVRLPSALCAIASLWLVYSLAERLLGATVARVTAVLFALSPFVLYFGQEARMYTLLGLLVLVNCRILVGWLEHPTRAAAAAYVGTAILGAYTHIFFLFTLLAQLAFLLLDERGLGERGRKVFAAQALVGASFVPWLLLILTGVSTQSWKGIEHVVFGIPYTVLRFTIGYAEFIPNYEWKERIVPLALANSRLLAVTAVALAGLGIAGLLHLWRAGRGGLFVLCGLFGPMLLATLGSLLVVIVGDRYLIVSLPFFLMLLAAGMVELVGRGGIARVAGLALAVALGAVTAKSLWAYQTDAEFGKEPWSQVAGLLREQRREDDVLLVHSGFAAPPLRYYYPESPAAGLLRSDAAALEDVQRAERIWLILSHAPDAADYLAAVKGTSHGVALDSLFPQQSGIRVVLLDRQCLGSPDVWVEERFVCYSSTADLFSDPGSLYAAWGDRNADRIALDPEVGVASLGLTRSMRYDWPADAGKDYELGRVIALPEPVRELWAEVWLRFSPEFTTDGPESGNPDYKTLMAHVQPDGRGRWEFKVGEGAGHRLVVGESTGTLNEFATGEHAVSELDHPGAGRYWDGRWYRHRVHFRLESAPGARDGATEMWIMPEEGGDVRYVHETGMDTDDAVTGFDVLYLGANLNKGTRRPMSAWWGSVRAWKTDPGWSCAECAQPSAGAAEGARR